MTPGAVPGGLEEAARKALAEVAARGTCDRALAVELARGAILAGLGGRWALEVLDGAPTAPRAVVELAVAVVTGGLASAARERASGER